MIDDVIGLLRCPQCDHGGALARVGGTVRCGAGHCFDLARAGYVSLLPPGTPKNAGDTAAMVRARHEFLSAGHFAGLATAIAEAAAGTGASAAGSAAADSAAAGEAGCVVDVGAGTGYYLAAILDRLPAMVGIALDISKNALRLAARAHQRAGAVGCDAWRPLPIADAAADLVLNLFAPRDGAELRRVLAPGGALVLGTPAAEHLGELAGPLGLLAVDERKQARLDAKLNPHFELAGLIEHRERLWLDHRAVRALVAMGPSSWHIEADSLAVRIGRLPDPVPVTLAVRIASYHPAARPRAG